VDIYKAIVVAGPFAILPALDWLMHKISGTIAQSIEPLIPEGRVKTALFRVDESGIGTDSAAKPDKRV